MALTPDEFLRSADPDQLSYAAEDIGRALGEGRNVAEELRGLRRQLADLDRENRTFESGFRAALDHVLGGYLAATRHSAHLQDQAQAALSRPNWVKVLRVLRGGATRPGQIASSAGLQSSAVTRTLNEMAKEGLVERLTALGGDQRTRPVALTRFGQELCDRLPERLDQRVEVIRELAPILLGMLTFVAEQAETRTERIAQLAEHKLSLPIGMAMAGILLQEAKTWGLVRTSENSVSFHLAIRKESPVICALQSGDNSFLHRMREWAKGTMVVVRASQKNRFHWDRGARNIGFDNFRTIGDDDFLIGNTADFAAYSLAYESKPLLALDAQRPEAVSLMDGATRKGCVVDADEDASEGFERLAAA